MAFAPQWRSRAAERAPLAGEALIASPTVCSASWSHSGPPTSANRSTTSAPASATAAESMLRAGVHRLLVIDEGILVGILGSMDIVRAVAEHRLVTASPEARATPRVWADVRR
jgi:hypothetical protein